MPTYEYECRDCGHRFEEYQSITAKPLTACPRCKGQVKRLVSGGAGLIFKGSGFHITDYRSESYKKKARGEGGKVVAPCSDKGGGGGCGAGGCGAGGGCASG
jgi:putative FmdB family regulatory protein